VNDLCSAESGDCEDSAAIRSSPASAADDSSAELDSEPIDMRGADWIAEPGSWSPRCSFACCTASARLIVCWKARSKQSGSSHWWCARLLGCWGQIMLEWIASRWLSPLGLLVARLSLSLSFSSLLSSSQSSFGLPARKSRCFEPTNSGSLFSAQKRRGAFLSSLLLHLNPDRFGCAALG